jgi:hypothetical protein
MRAVSSQRVVGAAWRSCHFLDGTEPLASRGLGLTFLESGETLWTMTSVGEPE